MMLLSLGYPHTVQTSPFESLQRILVPDLVDDPPKILHGNKDGVSRSDLNFPRDGSYWWVRQKYVWSRRMVNS